jgi:hypothetical protein
MAVHFVFDDRFLDAVAHDEHRVLRRKLLPYSAWHELNLQAIDSPVLTGEPITEIKDVVAFVRICTSRYRTGGPTPELRARWRHWWAIWQSDLKECVEQIDSYLMDYAVGPKFWPNQHLEKGGGEGDRDIDDLLEAVCWYERNTCCGDEAAWNMPLALLRWKNAAFSKFEGADVQIWTPIHDELKKKNDAKRERMIAEMAEALVKGWSDPKVTGMVVTSGVDEEKAKVLAKGGMEAEKAAALAKDIYWRLVRRNMAAMKAMEGMGKR